MEKGMMVSPKLVPFNSLHSCHWEVPGLLLSLSEKIELFTCKDLGAAEMRGTRGSCFIGPTDSFSAFKIHFSLFFLGSELPSDLQQRHGITENLPSEDFSWHQYPITKSSRISCPLKVNLFSIGKLAHC